MAVAASGLAGGMLGPPTVFWLYGDYRRGSLELLRTIWQPGTPLVLLLTTGVLSALLMRNAGRAPSAREAMIRSVGNGMLFGALNVGLALATLAVTRGGGLFAAAAAFLLGCFGGVFLGAPIGFAYGMLFALPAREAAAARLDASHDALDRVLVFAGLVLVVSAFLALVLVALGQRDIPPWIDDSPSIPRSDYPDIASIGFAGAVGGLGALAAVAGSARCLARQWFLRRVARGLVPGWIIRPPRSDEELDELAPLVRGLDEDGVLAREPRPEACGYREQVASTPVALAPLTWS